MIVRYILYYSVGSANLVVRMALEELGVAYSDVEVPSRQVNRDADFMRLNPRGLVPVLVDKNHDVTIFETGAILLYLADQHGRLAPSAGLPKERAQFLKWLFVLSNTLHADLNARFYSDRYVGSIDTEAAFFAINRSRIVSHLEVLDATVAEHSGSSLLPWGLTVCDFYLGCLVRWAQIYPPASPALVASDLPRFQNLCRMLASLQERPAIRRSFERENITGPGFLRPALKDE